MELSYNLMQQAKSTLDFYINDLKEGIQKMIANYEEQANFIFSKKRSLKPNTDTYDIPVIKEHVSLVLDRISKGGN
ncbi:MAG TPA: hypothetical protein VNR61_18565 [Niallia sp.]|nr:hypothetical protein [Niallia sp.]